MLNILQQNYHDADYDDNDDGDNDDDDNDHYDDDDGRNPTSPPLTSAGLKPSHPAKMCLCRDQDFDDHHE